MHGLASFTLPQRISERAKLFVRDRPSPFVARPQFAVCYSCGLSHKLRGSTFQHRQEEMEDWREKHPRCQIGVSPTDLDYQHNADVKEAFQGSEQSMTVTNLQSLASSATAGWTSNYVDSSSNLYLDALVMVHIAAVNTAPANDKNFYLFAYGSTDGSIFTSTGTSGGTVGTEGSLTFPSISTLPIVMPMMPAIPYPVQNKAIDAGPFSVARWFGGILPQYWGVAVLNFSGMTLASSGNTIKYRGVYNTVT